MKINCVMMRGRNDDELAAFAALARDTPVVVRFIELMPVADHVAWHTQAYLPAAEILERLAPMGLTPVDDVPGNGPARYYTGPGWLGRLGVITPLGHEYCERCNRVRLGADGRLRLCLFGDTAIDLRAALHSGGPDAVARRITAALAIKPERHHLAPGQTSGALRALSQIGG